MDIKGIIVPLVTPVKTDGTPDLDDLESLLHYVIDNGVHGVFLFGTMGLYSHFTISEKKEVIRKTIEVVRGRIKVMVGIADPDIRQSVLLSDIAEQEGADAIVVFHLNNLPLRRDSYILDYYQYIIDKSKLPFMLYLNPAVSGGNLSPDNIESIIRNGNIVGVKDSSGSVKMARSLLSLCKPRNLKLFQGEISFAGLSLAMGYDGLIPGTACIFPRLFVDFFHEISGNERLDLSVFREGMEVTGSTLDIYLTQNNDLWPGAAFHSLKVLGVNKGIIPEPFRGLSDAEMRTIERCVLNLQESYNNKRSLKTQ